MKTITIKVTDPDGRTHSLEAPEGWRAMEVIRDSGLPIRGDCGGACACATCHVYVGGEWTARLPPPQIEETEMLDGAFDIRANSRLCCQIILDETLDGIEMTIAPTG